MIVSSLNAQEELIKASDHLGNIAEAYLELIPEISHFYSYKKVEAERVLSINKRKKDRDIWKKPLIICPKCGLVLKNKLYTRSTIKIKKISAKSKRILLVCNLCRYENDLFICKKAEAVNIKLKQGRF